MKKIILLLLLTITTSCSSLIPLQANLDNQTLLLTESKDILAQYQLDSKIKDGELEHKVFLKNGKKSSSGSTDKYQSETAFKKIYKSYLLSKFNSYSDSKIKINIMLVDLKLVTNFTTSTMIMLNGQSKYTRKAIGNFYVKIVYNGKEYQKDIQVSVDGYNETTTSTTNNYRGQPSYNRNSISNPTQQKSKLLENMFNKSIIQVDKYLDFIISKN